jgi:hypothetical protein
MFALSSNLDAEGHINEDNYGDQEKTDIPKYLNMPQKTITFNIEGEKYSAATQDFKIFAFSYWYLTPEEATYFIENEDQCYTLTYEQLEKGKFKWDKEYHSSFKVDLTMIPEAEKWDSLTVTDQSREFYYNADNLFSDEGSEHISLCCNYSVKDGVTVQSKKCVLN